MAALDGFGPRFQAALTDAILWRLGVLPRDPAANRAVARATERGLRESGLGIDRFFFDAFGGRAPDGEPWAELRAALAGASPRKPRAGGYWTGEPCAMLIDEVEAIWSAIADHDDWDPFQSKIVTIRRMGEAMRQLSSGSSPTHA